MSKTGARNRAKAIKVLEALRTICAEAKASSAARPLTPVATSSIGVARVAVSIHEARGGGASATARVRNHSPRAACCDTATLASGRGIDTISALRVIGKASGTVATGNRKARRKTRAVLNDLVTTSTRSNSVQIAASTKGVLAPATSWISSVACGTVRSS